MSSQYYLLIQSIRRYVTEFRSGALAEHVVSIDVRLERKIAKIVESHFDVIFYMMHKFQVCFGNIDEKYIQN